ncbi:MAG: hypothetical protein RLZZ298_1727 [Pseudomonadota bacterium]|jgi:hypothetical protein
MFANSPLSSLASFVIPSNIMIELRITIKR